MDGDASGKDDGEGISVSKIDVSPEWGKTTVTLKKGNEFAKVEYDQMEIQSPPALQQPVVRPGANNPRYGAPGQPPRPAIPRPVPNADSSRHSFAQAQRHYLQGNPPAGQPPARHPPTRVVSSQSVTDDGFSTTQCAGGWPDLSRKAVAGKIALSRASSALRKRAWLGPSLVGFVIRIRAHREMGRITLRDHHARTVGTPESAHHLGAARVVHVDRTQTEPSLPSAKPDVDVTSL